MAQRLHPQRHVCDDSNQLINQFIEIWRRSSGRRTILMKFINYIFTFELEPHKLAHRTRHTQRWTLNAAQFTADWILKNYLYELSQFHFLNGGGIGVWTVCVLICYSWNSDFADNILASVAVDSCLLFLVSFTLPDQINMMKISLEDTRRTRIPQGKMGFR